MVDRLKNQRAYWNDDSADLPQDLYIEVCDIIDRFDGIKVKLLEHKKTVKDAYELMKQYEKSYKIMEVSLLKNQEYISHLIRFGISQTELLKQEKSIQLHLQDYRDKSNIVQLVDDLANQIVANYSWEDSRRFKTRAVNLREQYEKILNAYTSKLEVTQRYLATLVAYDKLTTQVLCVLESTDKFLDDSMPSNLKNLSSWADEMDNCKRTVEQSHHILIENNDNLKTLIEIDPQSGNKLKSRMQELKDRYQYIIETLENQYDKCSHVLSLHEDYSLRMDRIISWVDIVEEALDAFSNSLSGSTDQSHIEKLTDLANDVSMYSMILEECQLYYKEINSKWHGENADNIKTYDDNVRKFNDICEKIKQYQSHTLLATRNTEAYLSSYRALLQYIEEVKLMKIVKLPLVDLKIVDFEENILSYTDIRNKLENLGDDFRNKKEQWLITSISSSIDDSLADCTKSADTLEQDYTCLLLELNNRKEVMKQQHDRLSGIDGKIQNILALLEDIGSFYQNKELILVNLEIMEIEVNSDKVSDWAKTS